MYVYTNCYIISVYLYVVEANTCSILVIYIVLLKLVHTVFCIGQYVNLLKGGVDFYLAVLKQIMEL